MIVSYNRGVIDSLCKKGLFEDLYTMLDKDPDISRDDIMPNVLMQAHKSAFCASAYIIRPSLYFSLTSNCDIIKKICIDRCR